MLSLGLAFPDHERSETKAAKRGTHAAITSSVCLELREPECAIPLRSRRPRAPRMAMPEAAVNEDGPSSSSVREIGRPWKISIPHSETATSAGDRTPHEQLRCGAVLPDTREACGSLLVYFERVSPTALRERPTLSFAASNHARQLHPSGGCAHRRRRGIRAESEASSAESDSGSRPTPASTTARLGNGGTRGGAASDDEPATRRHPPRIDRCQRSRLPLATALRSEAVRPKSRRNCLASEAADRSTLRAGRSRHFLRASSGNYGARHSRPASSNLAGSLGGVRHRADRA